jgi:hypothetical protein
MSSKLRPSDVVAKICDILLPLRDVRLYLRTDGYGAFILGFVALVLAVFFAILTVGIPFLNVIPVWIRFWLSVGSFVFFLMNFMRFRLIIIVGGTLPE